MRFHEIGFLGSMLLASSCATTKEHREHQDALYSLRECPTGTRLVVDVYPKNGNGNSIGACLSNTFATVMEMRTNCQRRKTRLTIDTLMQGVPMWDCEE